jgi:hypothetical protein
MIFVEAPQAPGECDVVLEVLAARPGASGSRPAAVLPQPQSLWAETAARTVASRQAAAGARLAERRQEAERRVRVAAWEAVY